ncbi:MAG: UDP-N-acetylmuramoyl-L-alanyl-D-glutamate--2,6-diaminopimelate ligase [Acidimicrobiales bacterium]
MDKTLVVALEKIVERVHPLAVVGTTDDVAVTQVAFDNRSVVPGALFCCLVGEHADGHDFAAAAYRRGAIAFICEHTLGRDIGQAPQLVVAPGMARPAMALAACAFYDDPGRKLRMVGVTGTNGKTTTTQLLRDILEVDGWPTGVIGTLGGARTTPEAPKVQQELSELHGNGAVACAMEVTSHALSQHRVDGILFDVAVFTNLSQDHLDYHHSMESYFAAKAELFTPDRARFAVVNRDDEYGRRLIARSLVPTVSYSLDDARNLEVGLSSTRFRLGKRDVIFPMGGRFNVMNALAAAFTARALGVGSDGIVEGLARAERVPGRFEAFEGENGVVAVVDYAHTPAGLEEVLRAVRRDREHDAVDRASVTVIFGAGGDRDRGKRPAMGAIASRLADVVVLTNDNPRSEDPQQIVDDIRAGMSGRAQVVVELDRRKAILDTLRSTRPGDVVVVAGKGHETTQEFSDRTIPFDDREIVRGELDRLGWRAKRRRAEIEGQAGES